MSILIGADLVPTQSNIDMFKNGDIVSLIGSELMECLNSADYRIFNIEAPITDIFEPILKCGPNLRIPSVCINGLSLMKIDLVTLANNHILDQGERGLIDTHKYLDEAGIQHIGTGFDNRESQKAFCFQYNDKKIGVYACAEHEFSIATDISAGANPFDPLESPDYVYKLKRECDYVIVLYHGGKEFYRYPSPLLQKTCRKMIDKGADLVVCQHSHCIGCEEHYKDGLIVYGQGNFIFDRGDDEYWNSGLLIKIDKQFEISYIPITKKGASILIAPNNEKKRILDGFYRRSEEIRDSAFIQQKYEEFARQKYYYYLSVCCPENKSLINKIMNKLSKGLYSKKRIDSRFKEKELLKVYNCIDCEAHRELFVSGLKGRIDK